MARLANSNGHKTINSFFGSELADSMATKYGTADLVMANKLVCRYPRSPGHAAGDEEACGRDGNHFHRGPLAEGFRQELPDRHHLRRALLRLANIRAFTRLAHSCGLKIVDVRYLPKQLGGSVRVLRKEARKGGPAEKVHAAGEAVRIIRSQDDEGGSRNRPTRESGRSGS